MLFYVYLFIWPLQDTVLHFFAKSFSSSPLKVTREIYTILGRLFWVLDLGCICCINITCLIYNLRCLCVAARSVESSFLSHKFSFPAGSAAIDVTKPEISRLLKQVQKSSNLQQLKGTYNYRLFMEQACLNTVQSLYLLHLRSDWWTTSKRRWRHFGSVTLRSEFWPSPFSG